PKFSKARGSSPTLRIEAGNNAGRLRVSSESSLGGTPCQTRRRFREMSAHLQSFDMRVVSLWPILQEGTDEISTDQAWARTRVGCRPARSPRFAKAYAGRFRGCGRAVRG